MAKNKHLTDAERLQIELWLQERLSFKQIASKLGKSASTISREVRSRAVASNKSAPFRIGARTAGTVRSINCVKTSRIVQNNVRSADGAMSGALTLKSLFAASSLPRLMSVTAAKMSAFAC